MAARFFHNIDRQIQSFSTFQWSCVLFIVSFSLAVSFSFAVFPLMGEATSGLDPDGYGYAGKILYETGLFPSISKAPLYPAFIASISWLFGGYRIWVIQLGQCLLFSLTIRVLYAIFRLTLSANIAKYAGLFCAVYPMSIWYIPRLWTETFLSLMIALFTLSLIITLQKPSIKNLILCGILFALAALSKGIAIIFLPLTILVLAIRFRSKSLLPILLFTFTGMALIAPWTWRNWRMTGRFVPIHANGGYNFYLGNGFTKHWLESPFSYADLKTRTEIDMEAVRASTGFDPGNPLSVDDALMQAALDEIMQKPILLVQKLFVQTLTFWYLAASLSKSLLTGCMQIPIVLLALPGLVRALRQRSWALCLIFPIIGIMGAAVLIFSFGRLSVTIIPYLIGIMVYGLTTAANTA